MKPAEKFSFPEGINPQAFHWKIPSFPLKESFYWCRSSLHQMSSNAKTQVSQRDTPSSLWRQHHHIWLMNFIDTIQVPMFGNIEQWTMNITTQEPNQREVQKSLTWSHSNHAGIQSTLGTNSWQTDRPSSNNLTTVSGLKRRVKADFFWSKESVPSIL